MGAVALRRSEGFGGIAPSAEVIWAGVTSGGTTFATLVADLSDTDRQRVKDEFLRRCEAFRRSDGLHVPAVQVLCLPRFADSAPTARSRPPCAARVARVWDPGLRY